jgi:hypothetical protein
MANIDIQADLNAVNDQLTKMVEELNKINGAREQLIQQIQNMNGVAMYLRGKLPPEEQAPVVEEIIQESDITTTEDDITRTVEYP